MMSHFELNEAASVLNIQAPFGEPVSRERKPPNRDQSETGRNGMSR